MGNIMDNNGFVFWIMGPTSSGKTTLAEKLVKDIRQMGQPVIHYDGDEVRNWFGDDFGFSEDHRLRVVKTLVHLANKSVESGLCVIVSALTANENARRYVCKHTTGLVVCFLSCSIKTCAERDPKGLYHQAITGQINTLIGINGNYSAPKMPDLVIDTEVLSEEQACEEAKLHLFGTV